MSGYKTATLPWLIDATGRPLGVKESDGDETFIPTFSADLQSLVKPDGSLVTGIGGSSMPSGGAIADEALAARSLIYIKSTGHCALADSTAEGKEAVAFVQVSVASGAVATFSMIGSQITGFSGLTPGAPYYLGAAGAIVTLPSAPTTTGNVLMKVGTAISATTLLFAPEAPITL